MAHGSWLGTHHDLSRGTHGHTPILLDLLVTLLDQAVQFAIA